MKLASKPTADSASRYVPAAGRSVLTGLYDPAVAWTMRERRFRDALLDQLLSSSDFRPLDVADVGCGTGTFALALARAGAAVVAVDGDETVLRRARSKDPEEDVDFVLGRADELPIASESMDCVVMSLLLHHLDAAGKAAALSEARRVLRPGGLLHIADWGRPRDIVAKLGFSALRALDGFDNTREHARGLLPARVEQGGFEDIRVRARLRTVWGILELISARRR